MCRILCRVLADFSARGQNSLVARLPVGVYEYLCTSCSAGCAGVFVSGDRSGLHLTCTDSSGIWSGFPSCSRLSKTATGVAVAYDQLATWAEQLPERVQKPR